MYRSLRRGLLAAGLVVGGLLMVSPSASAAGPEPVAMDFDDVRPGAASSVYRATKGVAFSSGAQVEAGAARSAPHRLASRCDQGGDDVGDGCPPTSITMTFERAVTIVRLWVRADDGGDPSTALLVGVGANRPVSSSVDATNAGYRSIEVRSGEGGFRTATVRWLDGDTSGIVVDDVELQALPALSVSPAELDFRTVDTGGRASQSVKVTNDANEAISPEVDVGATEAPFAVADDDCTGRAMKPDEDCSVTVEFAPDEAGEFGAILVVGDTEVRLRGTGRAPVDRSTGTTADDITATTDTGAPTSIRDGDPSTATEATVVRPSEPGRFPVGMWIAVLFGLVGLVSLVALIWWRRRRPRRRPPVRTAPPDRPPMAPAALTTLTLRTAADQADGGAVEASGLTFTVRLRSDAHGNEATDESRPSGPALAVKVRTAPTTHNRTNAHE